MECKALAALGKQGRVATFLQCFWFSTQATFCHQGDLYYVFAPILLASAIKDLLSSSVKILHPASNRFVILQLCIFKIFLSDFLVFAILHMWDFENFLKFSKIIT